MRKTEKKNFIDEALELDEKQTPSDRIFNAVALGTGIFAGLLLLVCLILYLSITQAAVLDTPFYIYAWLLLFYPILIMALVGLYFSVGQLMRNHYFTTIFAVLLNTLAAAALITVLIIQAARGQIYIVPFYFL